MTPLAAYLILFLGVGAGFILVHLLLGKLLRPNKPEAEKGTIYECGEPTIGSAWVQFDLRYYVIALLFVIFDVEVAFFFPWADVFGKANALATAAKPAEDDAAGWAAYEEQVRQLSPSAAVIQPVAPPGAQPLTEGERARVRSSRFDANRKDAQTLGRLALLEVLLFFGILLVGFAYLWRRGDLAWVRSLAAERQAVTAPAAPTSLASREPVGVGGNFYRS